MKKNKILALTVTLLILLPFYSVAQKNKVKKYKKNLICLSIDGEKVSKKEKKSVGTVVYRNTKEQLSDYYDEGTGLSFLIVPVILPKKVTFEDESDFRYSSQPFYEDKTIPENQLGFYLFLEEKDAHYLIFSTAEIINLQKPPKQLYLKFK